MHFALHLSLLVDFPTVASIRFFADPLSILIVGGQFLHAASVQDLLPLASFGSRDSIDVLGIYRARDKELAPDRDAIVWDTYRCTRTITQLVRLVWLC